MPTLLNRLSVRQRIWMIVAIFIASIVLGSTIDVLTVRQALWQEKAQQTRQLVESGFSVLAYFHGLQQQGALSEAAAQAAAVGTIKAMRYAGREYFWLNDLGRPFPRMVMHPTVPELDGQVLAAEKFNRATGQRFGNDGDFVATDGRKNLFVAFVDVVSAAGQGYVTYDWPKPRAEGGTTAELYPKLSYVKKFEPWGWLIGSGVYIDDVDQAVDAQVRRNLLLVAGAGALLVLLATVMGRSIILPLRSTVATMREIGKADGDLSLRLPVSGRCEIGQLASGFNDMLARLQAREAELARHGDLLEQQVAQRTLELRDSNRQLANELAEREAAEQALHESEERFRSICATAQDAIIMLDDAGAISYWNAAAERIFGFGNDEAVGRNLHGLLAPPRFREAFQKGLERFRDSGEGAAVGNTVELAGLRRDGSEFPIELSISAIRLGGAWSAVGFVRDISERKNAEQAMRDSRARMRALLDATAESVLLLDPEGEILAINAFAAQRFHQAPEAMVGSDFFALMPPDLAVSRRAALRQVVDSGQPLQTQDRRGSIFFDNSLYPVVNEAGAVESVAVYAKDVTEIHRTRAVDDIFHHLDTMLLKWRLNGEAIAQRFCERVLPVFDLAAAWVGRAEKDGQLTLLAGAGSEFAEQLRAGGLRWDGDAACLPAAAALRSGERQTVAIGDPHRPTCGVAARTADAAVLVMLPLSLRGEAWGVLALYGRNQRALAGAELATVLDAIAGRLGLALDAALQQEWLTLLDTALAGVGNGVLITDAKASILWANQSFAELCGYGTAALLGKTPRLFRSDVQDADFYRRFWETIAAGRTWHGDIVNRRPDGSRYTISQTVTPLFNGNGDVSHFVAIIEDITERKAAEQRIQHSANYDLLTDLPNRGLFLDRLGQALALARRDTHAGALLFLDLDRFKQVNDQLGHAAGDSLLVEVARRLRGEVRESDTVARLSGDEFTVILPHVRSPIDAERVADKILAAIALPITVAGQTVAVGVSIGIALFPEHGNSAAEVVNAADHAMYLAKSAGRHRHVFAAGPGSARKSR